MIRIYKYSTLLLLFMTSGLLYIIVGQLDDMKLRYKIFEVFQFGIDQLFKLTDLKFKTTKDNTIWFSYSHIAPIVNLISSVVWAGLFLLIMQFINGRTNNFNQQRSDFWKKVFFTNLTLSLLIFAIWLPMDLDFIYSGVYSGSPSMLKSLYSWFDFIMFFPSIVPDLFAYTLDQGGDTMHGYDDMYLTTKTATAFASAVWSISGVYIYHRVKGDSRSD